MNSVSTGDEAATGVAVVFIIIFWVVVAIVFFVLHFLPGIIASARKHPQVVPIWLVNVFLGWTVIGWFAALIWAFVTERNLVAVPMYPPQPYPPQPGPTAAMAMPTPAAPVASSPATAMADEIAALARLRDQGVLTEAEFTARKHLLLGEAPAAPHPAPAAPASSTPPSAVAVAQETPPAPPAPPPAEEAI